MRITIRTIQDANGAQKTITHDYSEYLVSARTKMETTVLIECQGYKPFAEINVPALLSELNIGPYDVEEVRYQRSARIPAHRMLGGK